MCMVEKFVFWYWRRFKDIPHHLEVAEIYGKAVPESMQDKDKSVGAEIVLDYIWSLHGKDTIKIIAEKRRITRERVRQLVWKYFRKWKKVVEQCSKEASS